MDIALAIFTFLYGLIVGSFINVCAFRIPKNKSIVFPGSYCPSCSTPIKPYDNIPLISFLLLKGKCRNCGEKISIRYPLVELSTALLFLTTYLIIGLQWILIPALVLVSLLIVIFLIDFDHQIIPNGLIVFGLVSGFIFLAASFVIGDFPLIQTGFNSIVASVVSGVAASAFLLFVAYAAQLILKKEAMGGGDIKLAAVLGLFLGPYVFLALFLAFFIGTVISVLMMRVGSVKKGQPVAFGPFMAIGALITLYYGFEIWHLYMSFALGR